MTRAEIRTEILVRLGKDTTSAWTSEAIVNDWINQAYKWASGYKKWPFTEGRVSTTYTSSTEEWDFEGYRSDSFRYLQIGGKRLQKTHFQDYQEYREDFSDGTDKVYSDFGGLVFINPNADVSGTLTAWGQYMPANIADGDANDTTETVFSDSEDEGNQAIIERSVSYALRRDGKETEAIQHQVIAKQLLDELYEKTAQEQHGYHGKGEGMWKRFNVLEGALEDELLKRDQWF